MKQTSKQLRKQLRKQTRNKITRKSKTHLQHTNTTTKKPKPIILDDKSVRLLSMALLNTEHIKTLTELYNKNRSTIPIWTIEQIKQFVIDEKIQNKKLDIDRQYYGYCIFYNGNHNSNHNSNHNDNDNLVGYIIGKKTPLLTHKYLGHKKPNKFDLLFTIGLDGNFHGKGIGTLAIDLFIKMYQKKIAHRGNYARNARLYSDIAADNIASIRVFEKNNFHYSHNIIISGKPYKRYSRFVFID
jgi:RimJ/RimL family protein N-acetyltransferase